MSGGVPAGERHDLTYREQMLDAQAQCLPCKLCGGKAVISDAGTGAGYYIECSNSTDWNRWKGCLIDQRRVSGWAYNVMEWWNRLMATPTPPIEGRDADVERAREAAITAMGWTDPRMIEDGKRYLAGHRFATFGFGGECFLTAYQVEALRRCHDGAHAALQALGERCHAD